MDYIYERAEEYNPNKEHKTLIVFDDKIVDIHKKEKLNPIVTEIFIRVRKLNISTIFITQSYFALPKTIRLSFTCYFIMKIPNQREREQIPYNHSADINFQDIVNLYKKYTTKSYSF